MDGVLYPQADVPRITPEECFPWRQHDDQPPETKFKETAELDMAYGVAGLGRFRVNVFQQRGNVRHGCGCGNSHKIRNVDELNLPSVIERICEEQRRLVLVTGTTGLRQVHFPLLRWIDRINANRSAHVITIEDPIEFLHRDKKSFIKFSAKLKWTPQFLDCAARRASSRFPT